MFYFRDEMDVLGYSVSYHHIKPDPERLRPMLDLLPPSNKSVLERAIGKFSYYAKWVLSF